MDCLKESRTPSVLLLFASLLLASVGAAQSTPQNARLGLPELPPVTASSPLDTFFYADRFAPDMPDPGGTIAAATKVTVTIPPTLTGTGFKEIIEYQLPDPYDPLGPAHPMIVADPSVNHQPSPTGIGRNRRA